MSLLHVKLITKKQLASPGYILSLIYIYVRDRCKIRTVLKPSDGFEAGQTVLQLFISTTDGFKAVQTDEQLSWTVPKLCIKCTAARFSYIFVKIHVVQCATPPVLVIFS